MVTIGEIGQDFYSINIFSFGRERKRELWVLTSLFYTIKIYDS